MPGGWAACAGRGSPARTTMQSSRLGSCAGGWKQSAAVLGSHHALAVPVAGSTPAQPAHEANFAPENPLLNETWALVLLERQCYSLHAAAGNRQDLDHITLRASQAAEQAGMRVPVHASADASMPCSERCKAAAGPACGGGACCIVATPCSRPSSLRGRVTGWDPRMQRASRRAPGCHTSASPCRCRARQPTQTRP